MIRRNGADWLNQPAPLTPWQRERRDGPLSNDERHDAATPWIIAALILFSMACLMVLANGGGVVMTHVTAHAAQRWIERVNPRLTVAEAAAAIHAHDRAINAAAEFGCRVVRLAEKAKLMLDGETVTTVLPLRSALDRASAWEFGA